MMQQLYVFILVLLIIYLIYSIRTAGLVTAEFNGQIYMVQEHADKMAMEEKKMNKDNENKMLDNINIIFEDDEE
jgi:hypothetical protein